MVLRSKLLLSVGAILSLGAIIAACGSSGGDATGSCLPNVTQACLCVGGTMGVQACNSDGKSFGMCQCGAASGAGGSTSSSASSSSGNGTGGNGCSCNPSSELYCGAAQCSTDAGADASTGAGGSCSSVVTYAGKAIGTDFDGGAAALDWGSNWTYGTSLPGLPSGNAACQALGADHVCDYDDLVLAATKGELTPLATTDTAWLYRVNPVTVTATSPTIEVLGTPATVGTTYQVGMGSRCANWTYSTDHLNDGEYVSFEKGVNKPTYHFDDNPTVIQTTPKDIPCGHNGMPRAVLCCFPKCI